LLFGFSDSVDRKTYATYGFALMLLKYATEVILIGILANRFLYPWQFFNPFAQGRGLDGLSNPVLVLIGIWTLPFIWVGVSMTIRRAVDAGYSPWLGLLFFVPFVNLIPDGDVSFDAERVALALGDSGTKEKVSAHRFYSCSSRFVLSLLLGLITLLLSTYVFGSTGTFYSGPTLSNGGALGTPV